MKCARISCENEVKSLRNKHCSFSCQSKANWENPDFVRNQSEKQTVAWVSEDRKRQASERERSDVDLDRPLANWFGLSRNKLQALYDEQEGRCAICGCSESESKNPRGGATFAKDHNHITGEVRGLLCHRCNVGLGHFRDDPELLEKAVAYLRRVLCV